MPEPISPGAALAAMRQVRQLTCPVCGVQVEGIGRRTYCSESCKQRAKRAKQRAKA